VGKAEISMMNEIAENRGRLIAISISTTKGIPKSNIEKAKLIEKWGIEGDAHAGDWHRQISLLTFESIERMKEKGLPNLTPGIFAENLTTEFLSLPSLPIGTKVQIGVDALLEITQIGKECHSRCAIYQTAGDCVMPREGVFAIVIKGGEIKVNDDIIILPE
jgi:MOSC domain-containing protein YiiM